jgi:plastocyanin
MCWVALLGLGLAAPVAMALEGDNATVSFGQWQTDPPLDRFPNASPPPSDNHQVIPNTVTIKAGGAVNFNISGFHQVIIYDVGTQPEDINVNTPTPPTTTRGPLPHPPVVLVDDPTHRIYRGLDPTLQPLDLGGAVGRDRVEVVTFAKPGTYLLICGIRGHFVNDGMFGFVTVLP